MTTKIFEITRTVKDEDVPAARAELEAILEDVKERVPDAVIGEITEEPAIEQRARPFHISAMHIN